MNYNINETDEQVEVKVSVPRDVKNKVVINTAKVKPGDNVIVFGLGGIGLNVLQGARLVGANMIVCYLSCNRVYPK